MAFDPHQLDEIRARIKVSEVVGSRFPLIKKGAEYVVKDNESFTVNDKKGFWCEFGSGGDSKPHDIFDFLQEHEGLTFVEAVHELADRAGVSLKNGDGRAAAPANRPRNASASGARSAPSRDSGSQDARDDRAEGGMGSDREAEPTARGKKEVVAEWNYISPENELIYQVVRMQERLPDGSWLKKHGKIWKTFMQRRPDGEGNWILSLNVVDDDGPIEFVKTPTSSAWLKATEERRRWNNITIRTFEQLGNVEHWLYNANDVIDELAEPKEDQRTIFLPEGEGKVDVLKEWGLLAVTNSGGAKNFTQACAEFFRNARNVVILADNDRAGAERVAKIAPMLSAVGVELVQVLNFRDVWPACPVKGDVKDWRDHGGGTKDALLEIVDELKPWTPEPYKSKFGAKTASDLGGAVRAYPWRIKGILPMNDNVLLMGPSRSGKTFECLDMLMHVMKGDAFAGRKVVPGGYVYLTYEGATGFENRLRAYLHHHGMSVDDLHSFAWLTRPPNLFASEDNVVALATEIAEIAKGFKLPLAGIVVDTHNSATRGSSEIKSDDMNRIMSNYDIVKEKAGAPLIIIGHTNAEGRHRGNEQFFNNIETAILIERVYTDAKHTQEKRDDDGRVVRRGKISKQREGDDRTSWEFVLQAIEIGKDEDGDPITSMVSVEPAQRVPSDVITNEGRRDRPEGYYLNDTEVGQFKAMMAAIDKVGIAPPLELALPPSTRVIRTTDLGSEYRAVASKGEGETQQRYVNRIKTSLNRFKTKMSGVSVVAVREAADPSGGSSHFIWPTGRRVYGRGLQWPPIPKKKKEQPMILAPGEREDDLPPF